jgi:pimeloyl-ACP methyl ester carboxylesterase
MHFISETMTDGVCERHFTLGDIPGVLWAPAGLAGPRPVILIAHGGGQDKTAPGVVARARRYVNGCGFAAVALDAPEHGGRPTSARHEAFVTQLRQAMAAGEPVGQLVARDNAEIAARAVPEWQAVLASLLEAGLAAGPAGLFGISMGSMIGVPLAAAEPGIGAAVFGLAGHETLAGAAARITVPVEFLLQWDDEHIPRESGLALFDAFASTQKTLHANPGRHGDVPRFEADSSERFFRRHLAG